MKGLFYEQEDRHPLATKRNKSKKELYEEEANVVKKDQFEVGAYKSIVQRNP